MEEFWHNILPHEPSSNISENNSIDVVIKGCFDYYDTTACVRNSLLCFLAFVSFLLCLLRIIKLHILHHPQIHQYLVFYLSTLEILFLILKWMVFSSWYQIEFISSFLKMMQFILLCHFHWSLVSRILHQQKLISCIIWPLLGGFSAFFSLITIFGIMSRFSPWEECLAPHWLLLSFAEFLGIQLYVLAGIYITKKINSISALESFKREQKRDLWSVISIYEFSSIMTLAYYTALQALGNHESGCSAIFDHDQVLYSPVYAVFMVIKYFLPIWVMLLIFYPTRGCPSTEDERLLGWSGDGSTTSVFSPATRYMDSYKQLVLPTQYGTNFDAPTLRRSASSPAFFPKNQTPPVASHVYPPLSRVAIVNYGAMDSFRSQPETSTFAAVRTRSRHDSGMPPRGSTARVVRIPVCLNHCSDEVENVTPSSGEKV